MWIESKPDGKFKCVERYTDPMTDKAKRVSVTIDKNTPQSRKAAQKVLNEKIEKLISYKSDDEITFGEITDKFLEYQKANVKEQTYTSCKTLTNAVLKIIPRDVIVERMTARYLLDMIESTDKSNVKKNSYLKRIRQILRWSYEQGYVEDISFLQKIKLYPDKEKKSRIEDKFLSSSELDMVIKASNPEHWKLLIQFLALSGLRIGEAIALKDSDVTNAIHVDKTYDMIGKSVSDSPKTDAGNRDVFIQPELAEVIRKIRLYVKKNKLRYNFKTDIFFPDKKGEYIKYSAFHKYFQRITGEVIGRQLSPHALRHTHVSLMAEQGIPLEVISRRVGHENSNITRQIYLHVTDNQKEKDKEMISKVRIF